MSIWVSPQTLDELNAAAANTLIQHLGIVFTEIGADFVRATMPVDTRTRQPFGLLHGGASVVLAESVGSTAGHMCLETRQYHCVGQEINANHLRSVREGRVTGTARPVHLGGRSHVWSIEIADDRRQLVCISRLTLAVIKVGGGPTVKPG